MQGFSLDYEFCLDIYETVSSSAPAFWSLSTLKSLGAIILIVNWYMAFLKAKVENFGEIPEMKPDAIIRGIALILFIGSYDWFLGLVDSFLSIFEAEALSNKIAVEEYEMNKGSVAVDQDCDWMCSIVYMRDIVFKLVTDLFWPFLLLLEAICRFVDALIYGMFLLERFFFLWVLKYAGAVALTFYGFEKTKKWFWAWVGIYVAVFMLILPYMALNLFANLFYHNAYVYINKLYQPEPQPEGIVFYAPDSMPMMIVLILVTIFKFMIFKKAGQIIFKIFN